MPVKIQGEHSFDATREAVWQALMDPEVLARTLPGAEKLERVGENELAGVLDMRIGPVQGKFQGTVVMTDVRPPEGYHLVLKGNGAAGFVEGSGALRLTEGGGAEGRLTTLHYDVEAQVGGRIAGVGQRLLDSSARVVTRQALEGLERQIAARAADSKAAVAAGPAADVPSAGARDGAPPAPPPAPSRTRFAAAFAVGLLGELIPRERRPLAVAIGLALAALIFVVLFRACGG